MLCSQASRDIDKGTGVLSLTKFNFHEKQRTYIYESRIFPYHGYQQTSFRYAWSATWCGYRRPFVMWDSNQRFRSPHSPRLGAFFGFGSIKGTGLPLVVER